MLSKELKEDIQNIAAYINALSICGTVLITGATGLIGSLIVKALIYYNRVYDNTIKVIALARSPQKVQQIFVDFMDEGNFPDVSFVYQDICQPIEDGVTCDYIIHTANATASKYFMTNPVEVIDSIYTGTRHILDFAFRQKVKGMVYLSSMEVFGQVNAEQRISESELGYIDLQNIRSCYSEGKRMAECLCKCYAEQYGVPVKVARLAQTFGAGVLPGENRVFAQFARSALKGEDIVLHTKGESVGNYCYTADAIKAIILLLIKGANGEAYTIVNEQTSMTIADMADLVAENFSSGRSTVVFDIPDDNTFGYAPQTKMKLSAQKMKNLGWQPEVDLIECYRRMMPDLN